MRFEFIAAEKAVFQVAALCRVMNVQPSGFYAWLKRSPTARKKMDERLRVHIRASHKKSRKTHGSPRIHKDLKAEHLSVGKKRIARLMKEEGLRGDPPRKFRRTTNSKHNKPLAANVLNRAIQAVSAPNRVWAADITYIWTAMGWLYLAAIIYVYSRRIVGYAIDGHLRTDLVTMAFNNALENRNVSAGLLHHSNRGSQHASAEFSKIAAEAGIVLNMSRKGNCWDNAVAESLFATLKQELIHRQSWLTKGQTITAVSDYILNFYNRERRHSSIGYRSTAEYERLTLLAKAASEGCLLNWVNFISAASARSQSLMDAIERDPELSTLASLLTKAELASVLSRPNPDRISGATEGYITIPTVLGPTLDINSNHGDNKGIVSSPFVQRAAVLSSFESPNGSVFIIDRVLKR